MAKPIKRHQIGRFGFPTASRVILVVGLLVLSFIFFFFAESVRYHLIGESRKVMNVYARLWGVAMSYGTSGAEMSIIFDEIIEKSDFPMVLTDVKNNPQAWRNVGIAPNDTTKKSMEKLRRMVAKFDAAREPVGVYLPGSRRLVAKIHFGESRFVSLLRIVPIIEISIIILFLILGYTWTLKVRGYERQSIWLGMARETAHQLGTPISSLLGWIELLREKLKNPEKFSGESLSLEKILARMADDVNTLSRVVNRFGNIGFVPELKLKDPAPLVNSIVDYFVSRLPTLHSNISFEKDIQPVPPVYLNEELMSWAIENLIKNAIESVSKKKGVIKVSLRESADRSFVNVIVTDNGRGIPVGDQKKIFTTGFSTKRRGWGIGLSIASRIVEEYHGGKLFLLESKPYERTTFVISLPIKKEKI